MTAIGVDIRRLGLAHLNAIDGIEQRAYRTPWSRSMFASELAKPTSVCLGAFEGTRLVGYVVNSRYVDAWHHLAPLGLLYSNVDLFVARLFCSGSSGRLRAIFNRPRVNSDVASIDEHGPDYNKC